MKKPVHIFLIFILCMSVSLHVDAFTFTRTLTIGSSGQDVFELQKILNAHAQTRVAFQGAGSLGQETTYFGELTKQAVIKFQNLYAQQILIPVGISQGTGFVGKSTILFLNSQQNGSTTSPAPTNTSNIDTSNQMSIIKDVGFLLSEKVILAGENLYIGSQNKISGTEFYLGDDLVQKKCFNEYTCTLAVDKKTEAGVYTLTTNNKDLGTNKVTIISSTVTKPIIDTITLKINEDNLITGKNLSNTVTVFTHFGIFKSQTVNNSFILSFPKQDVQINSNIDGVFYIENENGIKSDILIVQYEI